MKWRLGAVEAKAPSSWKRHAGIFRKPKLRSPQNARPKSSGPVSQRIDDPPARAGHHPGAGISPSGSVFAIALKPSLARVHKIRNRPLHRRFEPELASPRPSNACRQVAWSHRKSTPAASCFTSSPSSLPGLDNRPETKVVTRRRGASLPLEPLTPMSKRSMKTEPPPDASPAAGDGPITLSVSMIAGGEDVARPSGGLSS